MLNIPFNSGSELDMIYFGTAGWAYDDWYGAVYPSKKARNFNQLEFLVKYLDTIEINSTFYFPPTPDKAKRWADTASARKEFVFTVKLWEKFTHKIDALSERDITLFKNSIAPLHESGKLGALLVQFPWSYVYSPENRAHIGRICESFTEYNPCVELRHFSWLTDESMKFFRQKNIGFVNIDMPATDNSLNDTDIVTTRTGYLRFHGRNYKNWFKKDAERHERYDYLYNRDELSELVPIIRNVSVKAQKTFVITNNHFQGSAFKNALELKSAVNREKIVVPRTCLGKFPDLKNIARAIDNSYSPSQGDLFSDI